MEITWSVIIAAIALLVSVLSAPLTTFLNNHHQLKIRNMEFKEQHRAEVIENYIRATGAVIRYATQDALHSYGRAFGEIFLYAPKELWEDITELDRQIPSVSKLSENSTKFADLCKKLAEYSPRKVKQRRNR